MKIENYERIYKIGANLKGVQSFIEKLEKAKGTIPESAITGYLDLNGESVCNGGLKIPKPLFDKIIDFNIDIAKRELRKLKQELKTL